MFEPNLIFLTFFGESVKRSPQVTSPKCFKYKKVQLACMFWGGGN